VSADDPVVQDVGLSRLGDPDWSQGSLPGRLVMTGVHRDGREFPIEASFISLVEGGHTQVRAFIRDITDRVAYEQQLADKALSDVLTGLPNRALFMDRLQGAISRLERRSGCAAVLFIDIDRFKVVNDSLGHGIGDELLVALGSRLRDQLRPGDTVARLGGDEFVVLCEALDDPEQAAELAGRILSSLDAPLPLGGRRHHVDVSIGIATVDRSDARPEEVLRNADTAMYRAKEQGGRRSEMFDDAFRTRALARLTLEDDLRGAIDKDEFVAYYQPVLTMDERIVGTEALLRWNHPTRGLLAPAEFVPAAEQTRLIVPLGLQVLRQACQQLATWQREGHDHLQMAVNLSGCQLQQGDLADQTRLILDAHQLDPSSLCLEITESMFMEESETVARTLQELRDLGVRLAVDDFGAGYSSLLYLRRFPLHVLKLDRSFVAGLGRNPADRAIVGSMIHLAHSLGLTAVAEGVEQPEQLDALRALGCDLAQGFYWSRPEPPEEIGRLLADQLSLTPSP
jgi:diguanylate cyclase (GGDEF)-like protein